MSQAATNTAALPFNILTDMASPAEWTKRAQMGRNRMEALEELFAMTESRSIPGPNGKTISLPPTAVTKAQAELLYYLVTEIKPILSIETGFTFGVMAGILTAAHMMNGLHGGHIPIQDFARQAEEGIGIYTIERLKLEGYQIMEHEPALVLPQIYLQKLNDGLKLVYFNSAEAYDEQMMEYFYINRLLNDGGIMAINTSSAARRELVEHIRKSRHDYAIRELDCQITLVQKPAVNDITRQHKGVRH